MKRIRLLFALVFVLMALALPKNADAAVVYTVDVQNIKPGPFNPTKCLDDACAADEVTYWLSPDVSGRGTGSGNSVTVDVYIFGDTGITFSSASITYTGTLYASSYVGASGWFCEQVLNDETHCAAKIDDNSNVHWTITGHVDTPFECASATTDTPGSVAAFDRYIQADLYKHTDPVKSATDNMTIGYQCYIGAVNYQPLTENGILYYNAGVSPNQYYKPTGTSVNIYGFREFSYDGTLGIITTALDFTFPTYVNVTGCTVTKSAGNWYSPNATPTCTIVNSHHITSAITGNYATVTDITVSGTMTAVPECAGNPSFKGTKQVVLDGLWKRTSDGGWVQWGRVPATFGCS